MSFTHILMQMFVLCIPILFGYAACKLGFLTQEMDSSLSKLILYITLPCLIVSSADTGGKALPDPSMVLQLIGFSMVGYLIATAVSLLLPRLIRASRLERGIAGFSIMLGNVGFIGYPVLSAIYGDQAVLYAAIANIPNVLFMYSIGVELLQAAREPNGAEAEGASKPSPLKRIGTLARDIANPTFVASLVLLSLVLLRVNDLGVIGQGLSVVGDFTTPAVLLVTGAQLANYDLRSMFTNWRAYVTAAARLLAVPLLMLVCLRGFIPDDFVRGIVVVGAAMPVAGNGVLFCLLYDLDVKPMIQGTCLSIIGSVLTIPLVALLV